MKHDTTKSICLKSILIIVQSTKSTLTYKETKILYKEMKNKGMRKMMTEITNKEWPEEMNVEMLSGKARKIALELRELFDEMFHIRERKYSYDYDEDGLIELNQIYREAGIAPVTLEEANKTKTYSVDIGGCNVFGAPDDGGLFRIIYDGGFFYDMLSPDGDLAYMDSETHWQYEEKIKALLAKHDCYFEHGSSWYGTVWEN